MLTMGLTVLGKWKPRCLKRLVRPDTDSWSRVTRQSILTVCSTNAAAIHSVLPLVVPIYSLLQNLVRK